jgi:hypothetical protein
MKKETQKRQSTEITQVYPFLFHKKIASPGLI